MSTLVIEVPRRGCSRPGRGTRTEEVPMHAESTSPDRGAQYAALIKPGDAVATPDDEVWVVLETFPGSFRVLAAVRGEDGLVCVEPYEQTETMLPRELVVKVADARKVRRS